MRKMSGVRQVAYRAPAMYGPPSPAYARAWRAASDSTFRPMAETIIRRFYPVSLPPTRCCDRSTGQGCRGWPLLFDQQYPEQCDFVSHF